MPSLTTKAPTGRTLTPNPNPAPEPVPWASGASPSPPPPPPPPRTAATGITVTPVDLVGVAEDSLDRQDVLERVELRQRARQRRLPHRCATTLIATSSSAHAEHLDPGVLNKSRRAQVLVRRVHADRHQFWRECLCRSARSPAPQGRAEINSLRRAPIAGDGRPFPLGGGVVAPRATRAHFRRLRRTARLASRTCSS